MNACLAPVVSMHGCAVTTVEGIGSTKTRLHAVQVSSSMCSTEWCICASSMLCKLSSPKRLLYFVSDVGIIVVIQHGSWNYEEKLLLIILQFVYAASTISTKFLILLCVLLHRIVD